MKSIILTYPGFQALPKGIKQMLAVSETVFFRDATTTSTAVQGKLEHAQPPRSRVTGSAGKQRNGVSGDWRN